jgi:hypothetical protein
MKKATQVIGKIIYLLIAFSPIFFLGYLLGIKLLSN